MNCFTPQQRNRAAEQCWVRSNTFLLVPSLRTEWIEGILTAGERTHFGNLLLLQCDINEAAALIQEYSDLLPTDSHDRFWRRKAWFERNPEQQ